LLVRSKGWTGGFWLCVFQPLLVWVLRLSHDFGVPVVSRFNKIGICHAYQLTSCYPPCIQCSELHPGLTLWFVMFVLYFRKFPVLFSRHMKGPGPPCFTSVFFSVELSKNNHPPSLPSAGTDSLPWIDHFPPHPLF